MERHAELVSMVTRFQGFDQVRPVPMLAANLAAKIERGRTQGPDTGDGPRGSEGDPDGDAAGKW